MKTFVPPVNVENGYEGVIEFEDSQLRDIVIHFPLYSDVKDLYIGVDEKAITKESSPYVDEG